MCYFYVLACFPVSAALYGIFKPDEAMFAV